MKIEQSLITIAVERRVRKTTAAMMVAKIVWIVLFGTFVGYLVVGAMGQ